MAGKTQKTSGGEAAGPARAQLKTADRVEIHELAARYGFMVDDRDWDSLASVFTEDALYVIRFPDGDRRWDGISGIRSLMDPGRHPLAHHVTNVMVDAGPDGVTMRSKVVGTLPEGRAASFDYRDKLRRTADGWRIAERVVTLRTYTPGT
jgi:ketosteroid isomerase-like protein